MFCIFLTNNPKFYLLQMKIWKILYLKWWEPVIGVCQPPKMYQILRIGVLDSLYSFLPRSLQQLVSMQICTSLLISNVNLRRILQLLFHIRAKIMFSFPIHNYISAEIIINTHTVCTPVIEKNFLPVVKNFITFNFIKTFKNIVPENRKKLDVYKYIYSEF